MAACYGGSAAPSLSGSSGSGGPDPGRAARESRAGLAAEVFRLVNRDGINYALLRNSRQVLSGTAKDVDILLAERDRRRFAARIEKAAGKLSGWSVVQTIRSRYGTRVVLFHRDDYSLLFDLQSVVRLESGLAPARVFLSRSLLSPAGPRVLGEEGFLICLYLHRRFKPKPEYDRILKSAFAGRPGRGEEIRREADRLNREYRTNVARRIFRKVGDFHYWLNYLRPRGIFTVVNGPDGVGKTTTLQELQERLSRLGVHSRVKHLGGKTGILPERAVFAAKSRKSSPAPATAAVAAPSPRWRVMVDLPRLIYHFFDIQLYYWLKIRKYQAIGGWFIADKYFTYTVKAEGMGFSVPEKLVRVFYRLLPRPDLYLLFWNEPEEIFRRKGELTPREAEVQARVLLSLSRHSRKRVLIKTDRTIPRVADEVLENLVRSSRERSGG